MAKCQVKTGFLVLRECGNQTEESCSICGSFVCQTHKRNHPQTNQICCIDCYAAKLDEQQAANIVKDDNHCCNCGKAVQSKLGSSNPANKVIDPDNMNVYCQECYDTMDDSGNITRTAGMALLANRTYDDDYWYGYRGSYYHRHSYKPIKSGHYKNRFDDNETRAFDPKNNPEENEQLDDSNNKDNAFDS